jgi:hypothetical protein
VRLQIIYQVGFFTWLKDNVYVAGWLSPLLAPLGMIFKGGSATAPSPNWSLRIVYLAFLTSLAAVFTPVIESEARIFAGLVAGATLLFIMIHAADFDERSKIK